MPEAYLSLYYDIYMPEAYLSLYYDIYICQRHTLACAYLYYDI
jgi:hypothetical protein